VTEFAAMLILLLVSSANILGQALPRQLGKSFMYIKNNRGPKLLPCGTPQVIIAVSDNSPLTQHLWLRLLRHDSKNLIPFSATP
jgi:hypothetical protein